MNTATESKTTTEQAYPLSWPPGWKRAARRERANFHRVSKETRSSGNGSTYTVQSKSKLTIADSRERVLAELGRLGARGIVISSNLRLRQDGLPLGAQSEPADPGVCVYFTLNGHKRCLPCDKWDRAADNLAAIAKFVDAMRGQQRWGVGSVEAAFAGYKALPGSGEPIVTPPAMTVEEAARVIESAAGNGAMTFAWEEILAKALAFQSAYRSAAKTHHPDAGGDEKAWHRLQQASDLLKQHHGVA